MDSENKGVDLGRLLFGFSCMIDSAGLYVESLGALAGIPAAPA